MLEEIFTELDLEIERSNSELIKDGTLQIPRFYIKVLGQTALIEAHLGLNLFATIDVDAYANFNWLAKQSFSAILVKHGLIYDDLSSEIWMPEETEYISIFKGHTFDGYIAKPEYVLISKLLKAREKNIAIVTEYLAKGPSALFLKLCKNYAINLNEVMKHA